MSTIETRGFPESLANVQDGQVILGKWKKKIVLEFCISMWDAKCLKKMIETDPKYTDLRIISYEKFLDIKHTIDIKSIKIPYNTTIKAMLS